MKVFKWVLDNKALAFMLFCQLAAVVYILGYLLYTGLQK